MSYLSDAIGGCGDWMSWRVIGVVGRCLVHERTVIVAFWFTQCCKLQAYSRAIFRLMTKKVGAALLG